MMVKDLRSIVLATKNGRAKRKMLSSDNSLVCFCSSLAQTNNTSVHMGSICLLFTWHQTQKNQIFSFSQAIVMWDSRMASIKVPFQPMFYCLFHKGQKNCWEGKLLCASLARRLVCSTGTLGLLWSMLPARPKYICSMKGNTERGKKERLCFFSVFVFRNRHWFSYDEEVYW